MTLDIEYLPAVSDAALACEANSPKTHSQHASNIAATMKAGFGDCAGVFAKADHVLTEHFDIHRGGCHSMECRGVVANIDLLTDALTISTSSQSPYMVRRHLAAYLKRDENDIRVMTPDVGGGFGPKANVYAEEFAVALAVIKSRRPVKWIEDRQEHFVATTQQRGQIWTLDVAFDNYGRMRAIRGRCMSRQWRLRAYGLILPATALASFPGPYALEALDLSIDVVLTNLVPTSPVRGACRPNVAFLLERLADRVARHLGMDRQEVRRRSFVRADQMPYTTGMKARDGSPISYDSGDYVGALKSRSRQDRRGEFRSAAQRSQTTRQAARAGYRILRRRHRTRAVRRGIRSRDAGRQGYYRHRRIQPGPGPSYSICADCR